MMMAFKIFKTYSLGEILMEHQQKRSLDYCVVFVCMSACLYVCMSVCLSLVRFSSIYGACHCK